MAVVLFAEIGSGNTSEPIEDLIRTHTGDAIRSWRHATVASFASASSALDCAVAVQSRIAARNRGANGSSPISVRLCVDQTEVGTQSDAGDATALQRASSIGATL